MYNFTYQKTLLHTTLMLVIKIVESRQCVLMDIESQLSIAFTMCIKYASLYKCYDQNFRLRLISQK